MRSRLHPTGLCLVFLSLVAAPAVADPSTDRPRSEIEALRAELAALRAEVDALRRLVESGSRAEPADAQPAQAPADARLELLQAQVAELARTKVESASRFPVRLSGTIHTHAFLNSAEANWMDVPNIVPPAPVTGQTGTFSAALRQTRFGVAADGPRIGAARSSGVLALDFFGGIPGFQTGQVMPLPRLLVGFARLETDRVAFQVGQDHAILAPRDPSSLAAFAFPLLFRSGNLYLRVPQARIEAAFTERLRLTTGIVAPVGGDLAGEDYRFVPPALGGERSRHPAVQAHLGYATAPVESPEHLAIGGSAHFGRERRPAFTDESWAAALDFSIRRGPIGAAGELFTGRNLDAFGGATGLNARTTGGWAELQLFPAPRLSLHGGFGTDRLHEPPATIARRRQRSAYANVRYALTPEVEAGFEYHWLATLPGTGPERRNHHLDWVLVYRF